MFSPVRATTGTTGTPRSRARLRGPPRCRAPSFVHQIRGNYDAIGDFQDLEHEVQVAFESVASTTTTVQSGRPNSRKSRATSSSLRRRQQRIGAREDRRACSELGELKPPSARVTVLPGQLPVCCRSPVRELKSVDLPGVGIAGERDGAVETADRLAEAGHLRMDRAGFAVVSRHKYSDQLGVRRPRVRERRRLIAAQGDRRSSDPVRSRVARKGRQIRANTRPRRESQVEQPAAHEAAARRIERDDFSQLAGGKVRQPLDHRLAVFRRRRRGGYMNVSGQDWRRRVFLLSVDAVARAQDAVQGDRQEDESEPEGNHHDGLT